MTGASNASGTPANLHNCMVLSVQSCMGMHEMREVGYGLE